MADASELRLHDETSPLLGSPCAERQQSKRIAHPNRVVWTILLLVVLIEVGDYLQRAPLLRFIESMICRDYYREHEPGRFGPEPIPERFCKLNPIQDDLNVLLGVDMFLSYLPSLFLTIPYGALSETKGRKFSMNLSLIGLAMACSWQLVSVYIAEYDIANVRWYLLNNAFAIIGGGASVLVSTLYTMLADIVPIEQRPTAFFRLVGATLITSIVAVPVASWMMRFSLWVPMVLATAIFGCGGLLTFVIPETLHHRRLLAADEADRDEVVSVRSNSSARPAYLPESVYLFIKGHSFLVASPVLLVIGATFIVQSLGRNTMRFVLTLASKRFDWSLAESSFLLPLSSIATLVLLIAILPATSVYLVKWRGMSLRVANLNIAQVSSILLVLGLGGIALSQRGLALVASVVVFSFGSGFSPAMRSVATVYIPPDSTAKAFAVFQTLDIIGSIATGPVLAKAYVVGSGWGGVWNGLPFLLSGAMYSVTAIVTCLLRLAPEGQDADDSDDE